MRELSISEVELVNGGISPMEVALGVGFVGLTSVIWLFQLNAAVTSTTSAAVRLPLRWAVSRLGYIA